MKKLNFALTSHHVKHYSETEHRLNLKAKLAKLLEENKGGAL